MSSIPTAPTDPNPNQRPSIPDQVTSSIHKLANLFLGYLKARFEAAKAEKGKYGYRQGIENETLEETLYHRINHKIRVRKERWGMKTY
mmetsp:Transcript_25645/g.62857  ORF Transcript_25645/g.62857 Transcript_25645/m.62857 type:complete len:88 (-) Transcript_25645:63-326(-)